MTSRRDLFSGLFRKPNGPYLVLDGGNPPDDPSYTWSYPLVSVGFRRKPPQEIWNDIQKLSSAAGRVFAPPVTDGKAARITFAIVSLRTEVHVVPPYPGVRPDHLLENFLDPRSIYSDATFGAFECRSYPQEYDPRCPWWGFHLRPPMVSPCAEHRNAVEFFKFDEQPRRGITGGSGTWLSNLCDELYNARDKYEDELKQSLSQAGDPIGQRLKAFYGNTLPFFDPTERGDYKSWRSWAQGRDAIGHTLRYIAEIKAIRYWYNEVARHARHVPGTPVDRAPTMSFIGTWVGSVDTPIEWEFLYQSPLPLYSLFTIPFTSSLRKLRATGDLHGDEAYRVGAFPRNFPAAIFRRFPPDPHQDCIEVGVNRGDPFTQAAREQYDRRPVEEREPWPELQNIRVPHECQATEATAWNRPFYTYPFLDGAIIRYPPYEPRPPGAPPSERERLQNQLQSWWEAISREMSYRRPIAIKDGPPTNCLPASRHPLAFFISMSNNRDRHFVEDATPDGVFRWATEISKRQYKRDKADIYDDEEQYPYIYRFLGEQFPAFLHTQFPWPCEGEFVPPSGGKREDDFPIVFPPPGKCMYLRLEPPKSERFKLLDFEESLHKVVPQVSYETRDEILGPPIESSTFRHPPPSTNPSPQTPLPVIHGLLSELQRLYHPQPIASCTSDQPARGSDRGRPDRSHSVHNTSMASPLSHRGSKPDKSRSGSQILRDRGHPYRSAGPGSLKPRSDPPSKLTSSPSCQSSQSHKPVVSPLQQTDASPGVPPPVLQAKKALVTQVASSQAPTAPATTQSTTDTDGAANDPDRHNGSSLNPPSPSSLVNFAVPITEDDQDVVMIDQSPIDRVALLTVESRKRSNAYMNGRLNRSLAPQAQCLDVVQIRFFALPQSEIICYPVRISNIYAPTVSGVQAVINNILGSNTEYPLEDVAVTCGMREADGTYCVELGFTYAEDAMSMLLNHGTEVLRCAADSDNGHIWHVSPVTSFKAGRSCTVFPQSLGCISPRPNSTRKSLLQESLARERRVEFVDQTIAYQSCIKRMDRLLIAISATEEAQGLAVTSPRPLDSFTCSLKSLSNTGFTVAADDLALQDFQSQWPLSGRTVAEPTMEATVPATIAQAPHPTQKADTKGSTTVSDEQERQMSSAEILKARRTAWARAKDLYQAWRSDDIPLPSIPVPVKESVIEEVKTPKPEQQGETSTRGQWKDLKRKAKYATEALEQGSRAWSERGVNSLHRKLQLKQESREPLVARHNARLEAQRAVTNNEFILIWDWYEACTLVIESARVSMAIPAVAWPSDLKPMDDKERDVCVLSQSFTALQKEFSPSGRWPLLRGPRLKEIEDLLKSRQSVPRHGSSNEPGSSADSMDTT